MNKIFKFIIFSITLNFAVGLMITAVPAFSPVAGLEYDASYTKDFQTLNKTVTPGGSLDDKGDQNIYVLDIMNIGFIQRFLKIIDNYMFGFINVLKSIVGGSLPDALSTILFGILKTMITIGYLVGGFILWTGRDIT